MFDVLVATTTTASTGVRPDLLGPVGETVLGLVIIGYLVIITINMATGRRLLRSKKRRVCPDDHGYTYDTSKEYCPYCADKYEVEELASIVSATQARLGGERR